MTDSTRPPAAPPDDAALHDALRALLEPVARLVVARGVPYAALDEMLRLAVVAQAHAAHPTLPEHRRVSRISASTGINRREVTRLSAIHAARAPVAPPRSLVSELFARWSTHPDMLAADGQPKPLPRLGGAPSFEALALSVTRDKHPRSLLEELTRLGLAQHDVDSDTVTLSTSAFVPRADTGRMLGFLGDNVGDHLNAAVSNVLGEGPAHFEQAIFADGLSEASLDTLRPLISEHWRALASALVPKLEQLIAADDAQPDAAHQRMRIGLFSYQAPVIPEAAAAPAAARPPVAPSEGDTP